MADLLSDNQDVMNSLLRALSDPGSVTPRAPLESLESWQRRAVIEFAVPYILAEERKWQAGARKAVSRARREIETTTEDALGDLGTVGKNAAAVILSQVQDSLDDIDQTIPPEDDDE